MAARGYLQRKVLYNGMHLNSSDRYPRVWMPSGSGGGGFAILNAVVNETQNSLYLKIHPAHNEDCNVQINNKIMKSKWKFNRTITNQYDQQ